jgi:5-methylcytosine-specific restriction enzyme subunit McrC
MHTADTSLLDFIIELLSSAADRILSAGLRADYVEREDQLPALRGRLLPDRQLLERFGRYDRVLCRYDEHEHDIADNQLLALALAQGARTATLRQVRRRARGLAAVLEEVCDPGALDISLGPEAFVYSRHNEHYRAAHALCWLVLHHVGLDEALSTGQASVRSFLVDMNRLFERFVERGLALALAPLNISVTTQRSDSIFWRPDSHMRYARVRPDCVVHIDKSSARLPVDAKYKRYFERRVDVDDLTQVFLYAYAYRDPRSPDPPRAMLIHPSESRGKPRRIPLEVRSVAERQVDAELTVVSIHIPTVLDEAETGGGPTLTALAELVLQRLGGEPSRGELGEPALANYTGMP